MATLQEQEYDGLAEGLNLAESAHILQDTQARYIQDALLDYSALVRRRGPVRVDTTLATFAKKSCGMVGTLNPASQYKLGVFVGDASSGEFRVLSDDYSLSTALTWNGFLNPNPYPIVDAKPALLGGAGLGTSTQYGILPTSQSFAFWRGGNTANYTTGTISLTRGSATVTGSGTTWVNNVVPGMFLFSNVTDASAGTFTDTYIGVIKSVESNTSLTLQDPSPYATSGSSYTAKSIRGLQYRVTKGRITTNTGNTTVTGANTKFVSQKLGTGTWNMYRASDWTWIGKVSSVTNELSITLAANAAVALNNERFIAIRGDGNWSLDTLVNDDKVGFLNAFYAGRQWYANNGRSLEKLSRVWFSDTGDPEGLDLTPYDGDFIEVSSAVGTDTPIKAIIPAYNGLVIIKENETYVITGNSPTTFSLKKILDDGCLSGMSAQAFGGGVVWAGIEGIYFYDGITVQNLSEERLGDYYKNAVRNINPSNKRQWGMVIRGHYFLFLEQLEPSVGIIKGSLSYTPTSMTMIINLNSRAITFATNLNLRGFVETPSDTGEQVIYVVNDNTKANLCKGFDLFDVESNDTLLCDLGSSASLYRYGKTAIGSATTFNGVANTKYFSKITLATRGAVRNIQIYSAGQGGGSATHNIRAGIYSDSSGSPNALLGSTSVVVLQQDDGPAFRTYSFATPVELAPGDYWIGPQVETSSRVNFYQEATASGIKQATDAYSDGLSDPFGSSTNINGPIIAFAEVLTCGPDFYIESKKYTMGDSAWKKMFKQLDLNYIVQGDSLRLDIVTGLQNIGKTTVSAFPTTVYTWDQLITLAGTWDNLALLFPTWDALTQANYKPKRIKFIKRSQMMSFRIWQNSPAVSRATIGPFRILYKWMRLGRV